MLLTRAKAHVLRTSSPFLPRPNLPPRALPVIPQRALNLTTNPTPPGRLPRTPLLLSFPPLTRISTLRTRAGMASGGESERGGIPVEAKYGTWNSPLTAALVSGASKRLGGMAVGPDDRLVWLEGRPSEGGKGVVMVEGPLEGGSRGASEEVSPAGVSVRSKVNEYGGGAFAVEDDLLVFCNQTDQRVLCLENFTSGAAAPRPLTPEYPGGKGLVRYADFSIDRKRNLVLCVREDHRAADAEAGAEQEPRQDIVAFPLHPADPPAEPVVVVSGADFFAFPRLSPDGSRVAWMQWTHPNMPWDCSSIWAGTFSPSGEVAERRCIAGGKEIVEAPTEPLWSPNGRLYFVTDRGSGFWNIHRETPTGIEKVISMEAEFSGPFWVFGRRSFAFHPHNPNHLICFYEQNGDSHLALIDVEAQELTKIHSELTSCSFIQCGKDRIFVAGGSPKIPLSIHEVLLPPDGKSSCTLRPIWTSLSLPDASLTPLYSTPSWVTFPAPTAPGEISHAVFYPPHNPNFRSSASELPPLLVRSHGGPTGSTDTTLRLPTQFWTSRGWAVADVNYSGSTGYGRAYRERLYGQWGVADVADVAACVEYLVKEGMVDGSRVATDGSSAGGFTVLAALTFTSAFSAGCSLYGICDLAALTDCTHKFEKFYTDRLVGTNYRERSPIHHVDRLNRPVILFQGLDDKVVPPEQARMMYEAVKAKGLPVAIIEYEGEEHGFKKAQNIEQTLEQEMLFFARVLLQTWNLPGIDRELVIENFPRV